MRIKVIRPKAEKRKIHSRNEFELCYLRHQYFRRVKYNPTVEEMKPFSHIVSYMSKNTFYTYKNLFYIVGLELEDVVNIGNVHLTSFLGLYSLENTPEKYKEFVTKFISIQGQSPEEGDVLDKNRANFTLFLKQRMEDVVRVCRQKARNIKGLPAEEYYYYYGSKKPPKILRELIKNHEKFGFRKLDTSIYKSVKKKIGLIFGNVFIFDNNYYVAVPIEQKTLRIEDFVGADLNPCDSLHNMNPEEIVFSIEANAIWEQRHKEFKSKAPKDKAEIIRNFIKLNKKNTMFKKEIQTARKMLKDLE